MKNECPGGSKASPLVAKQGVMAGRKLAYPSSFLLIRVICIYLWTKTLLRLPPDLTTHYSLLFVSPSLRHPSLLHLPPSGSSLYILNSKSYILFASSGFSTNP